MYWCKILINPTCRGKENPNFMADSSSHLLVGFPKLRNSHLSRCENLRNTKIQNFAFLQISESLRNFVKSFYFHIISARFALRKMQNSFSHGNPNFGPRGGGEKS